MTARAASRKGAYRVLHVIETMAPEEGGPPRVVAGLAVAQRALGIDAHVLCGDGASLATHLGYWRAHATGFPDESVHTFFGTGAGLLARREALRQWLDLRLRDFDLVHIHQLWRLVPTATANACRRARVPYLIAPHTSLSPWALAQKRAKKMLARVVIWDRLFRDCAGFHALNELEAAEIGDAVGRAAPPVFVVPNGVALREFPMTPIPNAPALARGTLSAPDGQSPFVLFLARLHTMKGPDLLLEAFAQVAAGNPTLQLVYAGPDFGMLAALQQRTTELGLGARVHYLGLVSGAARLSLLSNAVCLSQPSRDEGFSLSILEALACARPVVISDRCKFPEVAQAAAGVIVPLSVPELAEALRTYAVDGARRAEDGRHARELVERAYTWDIVANKAQQMYMQILGDAREAALCDLPGRGG